MASCAVTVVSVSSSDASPSLLVSLEALRVVVDCGEGLQRLASGCGVSLWQQHASQSRLLLTRASCDAAGGLPGFSLTCADAGREALVVASPPGLKSLWPATSWFMRRDGFALNVQEIGPGVRWEAHPDPSATPSQHTPRILGAMVENVGSAVCYAILTPPRAGRLDAERARAMGVPMGRAMGELKAGRAVTTPAGVLVRPDDVLGASQPGRGVLIVPNLLAAAEATRASQLGAALSATELAALPAHVQHALLADVAAESALGSMLTELATLPITLECVVHLSSAAVLLSEEYQAAFVQRWPRAQHMLLGEGGCIPRSPFRAAMINLRKLHRIDPRLFPALSDLAPGFHVEAEAGGDSDGETVVQRWLALLGEGGRVVRAEPLLRYGLFPDAKMGLDASSVPPALSDSEVDAVLSADGVDAAMLQSAIAQYRERAAAEEAKRAAARGDSEPVLTFLGTGSAIPSKYRNVSGIHLSTGVENRGGMLLDCGESSYSQLCRALASQGLDRTALQRAIIAVRLAWISHPHADHHLGLARFLIERWRLVAAAGEGAQQEAGAVLVVTPAGVLHWLRSYAVMDARLRGAYLGVDIRLTEPSSCGEEDGRQPLKRQRGELPHDEEGGEVAAVGEAPEGEAATHEMRALQATLRKVGLASLGSVRVLHCRDAYALVLHGTAGWKFVYSGDCRPSEELARIGSGATVLVHEATFEDEYAQEALCKRHCTVAEALAVARSMHAQDTLLTHFSQRYPKLPTISGEQQGHVSLAFDFLRMGFSDMRVAPLMFDALRLMFPAEDDQAGAAGAATAGAPS